MFIKCACASFWIIDLIVAKKSFLLRPSCHLSLSHLIVVTLIQLFLFIGGPQGAELAAEEGKSAAALAACRTLAEELTEMRFPAPRILAFKVRSFLLRSFIFFPLL